MSKGIELTQSQIKAYENGASMFIVPIDTDEMKMSEIGLKKDLSQFAPIQKGDKDIYIKEEFGISISGTTAYLKDYTKVDKRVIANLIVWKPASQMTKEQSRYTIKECIDVRVVRVQDIARKGYFDGAYIKEDILKGLGLSWIGYFNRESYEEIGYDLFVKLYNNQLKEQKINRTYEDNDYIFLCEVTPLKD